MSSSEKIGSEKRLILFFAVTLLSVYAIKNAMELSGLVPPEAPPAPVARAKPGVGKDQGKDQPAELVIPDNPFVESDKGKAVETPGPDAVAMVPTADLVLGSTAKTGPYRIEVQLDQKGAGVTSVASSRFEAEFVTEKRNQPKHRPLQILKPDPLAPPSLAMTLVMPRDKAVDPDEAEAAGIKAPDGGELPLDGVVWEVVRDAEGRVKRPVTRKPPAPEKGKPAPAAVALAGQSVVFRTRVESLGVTLTKTYRLFEGDDGFEVALTFESPESTRSVVYKLLGPHGIPIEGEWYTGTFRDAVFGQFDGSDTQVKTISAYDIAKRGKDNPERFQFQQPLRYSGVENQYFASVLAPDPPPKTDEDRWDAEAVPVILHVDPESHQKADIGVEITSKPVRVGPNLPVTHTYKVFAGPKSVDALTPFEAQKLALYRKGGMFSIPFAPYLATTIITPLLASTYEVTRVVSSAFGGKSGNYGVAIILLTMLVRLVMFPIGRKQALAAKKMQGLQPQLKEIQEKYKDDKEKQGKETWALYNRHGVNPVKGCLPALIQLPIFVGLWQALNNSVSLRHASFLYIEDLSAPDMLFRFPTAVPFLGDYFNLLPFLVVSLMLVQTKLFSPPATTPEAEAQQKMMKYMMVFMAFMFYKVPSGLGIYFITSSLWQISERLLLPKVSHAPAATADEGGKNPPGGGNGGGGNGGGGNNNNGPAAPPKPPGKFGKLWAQVLEEAQKNPTYRNLADEKNRTGAGGSGGPAGGAGPDRDRRDKGKPRSKPGRRR